MKKHKLLPVFLLSVVLFFTSFVFGYEIMKRQVRNDELSRLSQSELELSKEPDLEIVSDENIITPNTIMEERINYLQCNHVLTKERDVDQELINMGRQDLIEYLEENHPGKKMISYSSSKVIIGVTKNQLCENHYIIGEEDGLLAVYIINEDGERVLQTVFEDNPISLLMEVDQEKIIKGIVVDSEDELMEILENFIT